MKIKRFLSMILSIVCVVTLCVPVCAVESKSSSQIAVYNMHVTPNSGYFAVYFSVTGPGKVDKLGCESIYLYKMVDSRWILVDEETRLEDDPGMSDTDDYDHTNTIRCNSERGEAYKIVVTIFSENSKGRDTRSDTFFKIGQ